MKKKLTTAPSDTIRCTATTMAILLTFSFMSLQAQHAKQWVTYNGSEGPGKGTNIVFVSGRNIFERNSLNAFDHYGSHKCSF